jgi:hypothetical protein
MAAEGPPARRGGVSAKTDFVVGAMPGFGLSSSASPGAAIQGGNQVADDWDHVATPRPDPAPARRSAEIHTANVQRDGLGDNDFLGQKQKCVSAPH